MVLGKSLSTCGIMNNSETVVSSSDELSKPSEGSSTKKKKSFGRMRDVMKKMRATTFESGENCKCKILKCFQKVSYESSTRLLLEFNKLGDWNKQTAYLAGLISVVPIQRRYAKDVENANLRDCAFKYRVRVEEDNEFVDLEVCRKAFLSIHGITKRRLATIQESLKTTGKAPEDKRGRHSNRPHRLDEQVKSAMYEHINSFKGRASHYSLKKSTKIYLPEELSIKKMYDMFLENNPNTRASYECYRTVFNTKFNISFGYPRKDTCSTCDHHTSELKVLNQNSASNDLNDNEKNEIVIKINKLNLDQKLHLLRANTFYQRKKDARKKAKSSVEYEALCLDYQRNLPIPNITTNDVYYKRQLSYYTFNIHQLSNGKSVWYGYSEDTAKKGCNEVVSFLHDYITNHLDNNVKHLLLFCDSCAGQNKNFTFFRYCHYVVHYLKRLSSVTITFPMRGHSFLECDKNMGLINSKSRAEVPRQWADAIRAARVKPQPFIVIEVSQDMVRDWTSFFAKNNTYVAKACFKTRPIKEAKVEACHLRFLQYRNTFNGAWSSAVITRPNHTIEQNQLMDGEFYFPDKSYQGKSIKTMLPSINLLC